MSGNGLAGATRTLVYCVAALYAVACLTGLVFIDFESTQDLLLWVGFLFGGAGVMVLGQLFAPPGWVSAAVISIGALLGGLPLVWTIIVPVAVAVIVTCTIALARRRPAPA